MARPTFLITRSARRDLDNIYDFIAPANLRAAEKFIARLYGTFVAIARMPTIGRASRVVPGRRVFPVGRYVIYYRVTRTGLVYILRVRHSARIRGP